MKKKILVVEDDKYSMNLLRDLLSYDGHEIIPIMDGRLAIEAFHTHQPDLIIMDLMLNDGVLGINLVKELKNIPGFNTPIIGSTSETNELADRFYAECDKSMPKPIVIMEVLEMVK